MSTTISQFAQESVAQLYLGFFGRTPDTAGLYYWGQQIDQGVDPLVVSSGFARTPEFVAAYSGLSARQKIDLAYENILERSADPGGGQYWATQLENDKPISEIVWSLVNSAFANEGSADSLLIRSKINSALDEMAPIISDQPQSAWSISSGFGQINLAQALSAVLGISIQEGMDFHTGLNQSSITQWSTAAVQFDDVWAAGYTGKGVVIAAIDSGIDLNNASLAHDISPWSWNFVSNNANIQDDYGHGTAIASELIARPVDQVSNGLVGGAYDATLMVLKTIDSTGNGSQANLINAINYAVAHGANVINLSLGGGAYDIRMVQALENAADQGVIVVMAAGNFGEAAPQFPARYAQLNSSTIAVGSTMQNQDGSSSFDFSSNGAGSLTPYNYITAPGSEILAYNLDNYIDSWSGTSFATPLVTAAIANLLSANTGLQAEKIVDALVNTALNTSIELVGHSPYLV